PRPGAAGATLSPARSCRPGRWAGLVPVLLRRQRRTNRPLFRPGAPGPAGRGRVVMIDTHIHVVPPNLPGVGVPNPVLRQPAPALAGAVREPMRLSSTTPALAMGCLSPCDDDPLGVNSTLQLAESVPGLRAIGVANPLRTEPEHFRRVEAVLKTGRVV